MESIRILLVDVPSLLKDLLVDAGDDVTIVGEIGGSENLVRAIHDTAAEVLIVYGPDVGRGGSWREALEARSRFRVLTVANHGREVAVHELQTRESNLGQTSLEELVSVIRAGAVRRARKGEQW